MCSAVFLADYVSHCHPYQKACFPANSGRCWATVGHVVGLFRIAATDAKQHKMLAQPAAGKIA